MSKYRLEASVEAEWVAELPDDIDPETDLRSESEMEQLIADEIGVSHRQEVVDWDINCKSNVVDTEDADNAD